MNTCPPELHAYICQLACTDDGYTVRSLNLVSRYFRNISISFLYRSIAISGIGQINQLASRLENTPPHLRQLRHLYLCDKKSQTQKPERTQAKFLSEADANTITRILTLAAPTLKSLAFIASCPMSSTPLISRLFRISFPHLQDLTVAGFYPFPSSPGKMPSLERLHLTGHRNPHGLLQVGNLDEAYPSLTHLRVSGLGMAVSFAIELKQALNDDESLAVFPSKLPQRVRSVIVQPGIALPLSGKLGPSKAKDQMMMKHLNDIKSVKAVDYTLLERGSGTDAQKIRQDWMDCLGDGQGFWAPTS